MNISELTEPVARDIDATDLACPLPLLRTKLALAALDSGERLRVVATDPGSFRDIPGFCKVSGHKVLSAEQRDGRYYYLIEKA